MVRTAAASGATIKNSFLSCALTEENHFDRPQSSGVNEAESFGVTGHPAYLRFRYRAFPEDLN